MAANDDSVKIKNDSDTPLVPMDLNLLDLGLSPVNPGTAQASAESNGAIRQRAEEEKREAARQAEIVRQAAEAARQARLDADWRDADEHRAEYERLAQEKRAKAKEEAKRFLRNTVFVIIALFSIWQLPKLITLPASEPNAQVAGRTLTPALAKATTPAPNSRGASDLEEGGKLFSNQDFAKAAESFRKAAVQGNTKAQSALGTMYADGKGVPQDYVEAHMWFSIAAANGAKEGGKLRETVEKAMTPAKIAEAAQRAGEWMKAHQQ